MHPGEDAMEKIGMWDLRVLATKDISFSGTYLEDMCQPVQARQLRVRQTGAGDKFDCERRRY